MGVEPRSCDQRRLKTTPFSIRPRYKHAWGLFVAHQVSDRKFCVFRFDFLTFNICRCVFGKDTFSIVARKVYRRWWPSFTKTCKQKQDPKESSALVWLLVRQAQRARFIQMSELLDPSNHNRSHFDILAFGKKSNHTIYNISLFYNKSKNVDKNYYQIILNNKFKKKKYKFDHQNNSKK